MKKIVIINGHPDKKSYNFSLSEAYKKGASKTNAIINEINISTISDSSEEFRKEWLNKMYALGENLA
jgi:putative NADPH-quinone reductase